MKVRRGGWHSEAKRGSVRVVRQPIVAPDESRAAVYFILAAGSNMVKIGWVRDHEKIAKRIEALQTGCPFPLKLQFLLTPLSKVDEKRIQTLFTGYWQYREWFRCEGRLKEFLQRAVVFPDEAAEEIFSHLEKVSA